MKKMKDKISKPENKYIIIAIICTCIILFMSGIWLMDLGASAKCLVECGWVKGYTQSLFFQFEPYQTYHLGMMINITSFMVVFFIAIYVIIVEIRSNEPKIISENIR